MSCGSPQRPRTREVGESGTSCVSLVEEQEAYREKYASPPDSNTLKNIAAGSAEGCWKRPSDRLAVVADH